jgi:hypothetical protein
MKNRFKVASALALGVVAGFVAGVVTSVIYGTENWLKLKEKGSGLAEQVRSSGSELGKRGLDRASELIEMGKEFTSSPDNPIAKAILEGINAAKKKRDELMGGGKEGDA